MDAELTQFLIGLRPRFKTAIVSNAWPGLRALYTQWFGLSDGVVDAMIFSGEVGVAKPDAYIYQLALERLGVQAGESVFVDDFAENVEGARRVGMQGVHFKTTGQALEELRQMLEINATG